MRVEVLAVGTELLLGDVVDTNSAWLGRQLAAVGVDCNLQVKVGDNPARIADMIRSALSRCDSLIVCGGLGPTVDDVTREVIADVMGVPLVRESTLVTRLESMFAARNRTMAPNNLRQADVPQGAAVIDQTIGTAPGLKCPVTVDGKRRMIYALPGVPREMEEMFIRGVLPDLLESVGPDNAIVSRVLRTAGVAESTIDHKLAPIVERLDLLHRDGASSVPTLAYLASVSDGVRIRMTVKTGDSDEAQRILDALEHEIRQILGGDVYGIDDQSIEAALGELLVQRGMTIGFAESLTAGLAGARCGDIAGASRWFRGSLVAYASEVKRSLLGVAAAQVVSEACAIEMADGARAVLGSDVAVSFTGVAGPDEQEGQRPGTVYIGLSIAGRHSEAVLVRAGGDRNSVRTYAVVAGLDLLRRRL